MRRREAAPGGPGAARQPRATIAMAASKRALVPPPARRHSEVLLQRWHGDGVRHFVPVLHAQPLGEVKNHPPSSDQFALIDQSNHVDIE